MNVFEFKETVSKDITYCIVDNTSEYTNAWNKELIKNISDWTIQNLTLDGYRVLESVDENSLLRTASEYSKYAVVFSTGTEFINTYSFMEHVDKFCQETDFFLVGHILDRGDAYYELHHQCYIIDLEKYKELGFPKIGSNEFYNEHTQTVPERSQDNIHDDYTPKWIKSGNNKSIYKHRRHGWNLISIALDNDLPILVFDDDFRNNKIYYYPEDNNTFNQQINFAYNRHSFCSDTAIYPINSESYIGSINFSPLKQLIVPASGINWILYLDRFEFDTNTVVKFYDYSISTLEYMKKVIDWDGYDYITFVENNLKNKFNFLENGNDIPYCGTRDIEFVWQDIKDQCEWSTLWNDIKSKVKFEFHWVNLLDSSKNIDWIDTSDNTLINLSNIFNYIGTSSFYSLSSRVDAENKLIEKIKDKIPNAEVIFTRRAGDGFSPIKSDIVKQAKHIELTDINSLSKPTWHQNNDWTI